jgi:hypothetical protein
MLKTQWKYRSPKFNSLPLPKQMPATTCDCVLLTKVQSSLRRECESYGLLLPLTFPVWHQSFIFCFLTLGSNVKVKAKLPLCFFKLITTPWRRIGEWRYSSTHYLASALHGGEWSASRPGRFTPREKARGTPWIGGWVGPRDVLDVVVKRKIPSPRWESNPKTPIVQPLA